MHKDKDSNPAPNPAKPTKTDGPLITRSGDILRISESLRKEEVIALDTEFIRESTFYPKVALIQVATRNEVWLVDPTALSSDDMAPLFELLKDPKILKIMHAAYSDQECFYTSYGFLVAPVLDTAVAAALTGMGDNLGLGRLLKECLSINLPKGRARARWLTRPLPDELIQYAEQDVAYLVNLGEILAQRLKDKNRYEWGLEESATPSSLFEVTPEEMAGKVAKSGQVDATQFGVLVELFRWREERARRANLPRSWVADNETLIALSRVRLRSVEELRHFRGLSPKEVEKSGPRIWEAVERGRQFPKERMPKGSRNPPPTEKEEHILDLIGSYVAFLAAGHELATRFLLSQSRSHALWLNANADPQIWVDKGIISAASADLIGKDLTSFLRGERGLSIRNGEVEIISLTNRNET